MTRRRRYAETSAAAYHSLKNERVEQCDLIESEIRKAGHGLTILEIEQLTGIVSSTVSARLAELREQGRVCESVIRRHCTVNGRLKKLWVSAPDSGQLLLGRTA